MRKTILILLILMGLAPQLFSQYEENSRAGFVTTQYGTHKSVLFLLSTDADHIANMEEPGLEAFRRSVIGFWCGAQVALDEFAAEGRDLKVIVRDINPGDNAKLDQLFGEPEIQHVDLVIAAVAKNLFPKIAEFADRLHIHVINPFSTDSSIVLNHPYVCKMQPPLVTRPAIVRSYFAGANFILWGDTTSPTSDWAVYEKYFNEKRIPFHRLTAPADFAPFLSSSKPNVVIAGTLSPSNYTQAIKELKRHAKLPDFSWIIPESIITDDDFDIQMLKTMNIYFFSNNFVNPDTQENESFIYQYYEKFNALPSLGSFAYQGYDITRIFINRLYKHPSETPPLSYSFKLIKREDGGQENVGVRFVQMKNLRYNIIMPE